MLQTKTSVRQTIVLQFLRGPGYSIWTFRGYFVCNSRSLQRQKE